MTRHEDIDRLRRQDADVGAGRAEMPRPVRSLIEPGNEDGVLDDEPAMIADEDLLLDETVPAEEAAIRIVREPPPGANWDPDPGYIEDED
jgi:hypothetical protein